MLKGTLKVASCLLMVLMSKVAKRQLSVTIWLGSTVSTRGSARAKALMQLIRKPYLQEDKMGSEGNGYQNNSSC